MRKTKTEPTGRCDGTAVGGCRTIPTMTASVILSWAPWQPCLLCSSIWSTLFFINWTWTVARWRLALVAAIRKTKWGQSNKERLDRQLGKSQFEVFRLDHISWVRTEKVIHWCSSSKMLLCPIQHLKCMYNFTLLNPLKYLRHYFTQDGECPKVKMTAKMSPSSSESLVFKAPVEWYHQHTAQAYWTIHYIASMHCMDSCFQCMCLNHFH